MSRLLSCAIIALLLFGASFVLYKPEMPTVHAQAGACTQKVTFSNAGSSGSLQAVQAASVGASLKICKIVYVASATVDLKYVYGTGSNCATGAVDMTGTMQDVQAIIDENWDAPLIVPDNTAFCLNFGAASTGGGYVLFGR